MNDNIRDKLSGVFPPMVTPFKNDEIQYDAIIENVEKMNKTGLRGYFVLGTNGEYKALTTEERNRVLKTVVASASKDKIIMAGTGAESTKETIELSIKAAEIGANMVSLLMPHFFAKKMDDRALATYILDVAEESPVPVLIYNNPSVAAGVLVSEEVIKRVSGHPNVVGMKDSSKGNFKKYLKAASPDFYVLAGSANFFLDLLIEGGIGGVISLANVFPDECVRLYQLFVENKIDEAKKLSDRLIALNKEVSGTYGVAGVKAAMDIVGFRGGDPRRPLFPLTDDEKKELAKKLRESGFWKE